ncbi:MAG: hypothetical protein IKA90_05470, partial [Clostridia bacterium]|nr:hypothetical protein [Clostridia bacterium]
MTQFETFRFLLALIVFVLLTASFTAFIVYSIKVTLKLIKHGAEDKKLTKEYIKYGSKKHGCTGCVSNAVYAIASATIAVVMIVALAFSLVVQFNEGRVCTNLPLMNVVQSGSMSYVNEKNSYAVKGGYTDQIQMHDLIMTHALPDEKDLKVGDIVVYEVDNAYLIHRIVGIEEPNDKHPDERHFLLQGDANERPDKFPVRYSQMKSIYKGQRIAFVGSFITFMQSPAGWLCVLLVVFAVVATPIAERKLAKAKYARLVEIGVIVDSKAASVGAELETEPVEEKDNPDDNNPTDDNPDDNNPESVGEQAKTEPVADSQADSVGEEAKTEPVEETDEQAEPASMASIVEQEPVEQAQAELASVDAEAEQEPVEEKDEDDNDEDDETVAVVADRFGSFGEGKTFAQKLEEADDILAYRYAQISALLGRIEKVRVIRGKKRESYSKGRNAVAKLVIRGKTLNVYLGLDPNDYVGTKYRFVDKTDSKTYQKTPMQLKLTSDRQTKWAKELIADLVAKYGWTLVDEQAQAELVGVVAELAGVDSEAASMASIVEQEPVAEKDEQAEPASVDAEAETDFDEECQETAENSEECQDLTEPVEDCQDLSNDDEQKEDNQEEIADETVAVVANRFGSFGEGKTFEQKLEEADDVLAGRYAQISALLGRIKKVRVIRGKKRESYSKGRNAVAKLVIRGKTLNVYLGLDPNDYVGTKYRFVDKTDSKTYQKTPMQLKLTSDRQTKWAKELIADLVAKYGWTLLDEVVEPVGVVEPVEQAEPDCVASIVEQDIVEDIIVDEVVAENDEQAEPASVGEDVEQEPVGDVVEEQPEDVGQQEPQNEP